jgi:uncharacterized membrane protein YcaP (DUF421 family)
VSFAILFLITKVIGYRQVSELSMFDYINSITIGSIAAEVATGDGEEIIIALIAMIIFGVLTLILSIVTSKSMVLRRFIEGKPIILMQNGKIYEKSFKKAKMDINEFLAQCRISGYYNLSEINTAILEPNGKISFMLFSKYEPVTNENMQKDVSDKKISANLIIDGKIMYENLKNSGYDEAWLKSRLGNTKAEDIFLANEENGTLCVYKKQGMPSSDIFE